MGVTFSTSLKEISIDNSLRDDSQFIKGVREINKFISDSDVNFFRLREALIGKPKNGKDTKETSYAMSSTKYIYLTGDDIDNRKINTQDLIYLNEMIGKDLESSKLQDKDIIITRSGTVGKSFLFKDINRNLIYIPCGYLIIIKVEENQINPEFAVEYFNSLFMKDFFKTYSCGKNTRNISQDNIKKLPFPDFSLDKQKTILKEMEKFDNKIKQIEKSLPNTQNVIEKVFCEFFNYLPYNDYIKKMKSRYITKFSKIGIGKYLRIGARYHSFWEYYNGMIFISNEEKYGMEDIGNLIKVHKTETFKKGYLKNKHILIDKDDVEPKTGIIVNDDEYVEKIESDKVLFNDCDILISKIDPFLGHVILNDKTKPYIGTTEFVPYLINKDKVDLQFIKYVFLSRNFLEISKSVMAGKRQPRINPYELLVLKIPLPTLKEQKKASKRISDELGNLKVKKDNLKEIKYERDLSFMDYLA